VCDRNLTARGEFDYFSFTQKDFFPELNSKLLLGSIEKLMLAALSHSLSYI